MKYSTEFLGVGLKQCGLLHPLNTPSFTHSLCLELLWPCFLRVGFALTKSGLQIPPWNPLILYLPICPRLFLNLVDESTLPLEC